MALSADESKVVVALGPVFQMATLDIFTGKVMYSGTSSALTMNLAFTTLGVAMDTQGQAFAAYTQAGQAVV